MSTDGTYLIEVRMKVKEVQAEDLAAGDRVWYFVRRHKARPGFANPDAHGPFVVTSAAPFRLVNPQGVELGLDPAKLVLLVPTNDPPDLY